MTPTSCVTYGCGDKHPEFAKLGDHLCESLSAQFPASLPSPHRGARGPCRLPLRPRAERAGVRWGHPERLPKPTSPSRPSRRTRACACRVAHLRCARGPSLSPLKGGEGLARVGISFVERDGSRAIECGSPDSEAPWSEDSGCVSCLALARRGTLPIGYYPKTGTNDGPLRPGGSLHYDD